MWASMAKPRLKILGGRETIRERSERKTFFVPPAKGAQFSFGTPVGGTKFNFLSLPQNKC